MDLFCKAHPSRARRVWGHASPGKFFKMNAQKAEFGNFSVTKGYKFKISFIDVIAKYIATQSTM